MKVQHLEPSSLQLSQMLYSAHGNKLHMTGIPPNQGGQANVFTRVRGGQGRKRKFEPTRVTDGKKEEWCGSDLLIGQ